VKWVWLYLRERHLSHRVLDDYELSWPRSVAPGTDFSTRPAVSQA
jgi:hypothetical protein